MSSEGVATRTWSFTGSPIELRTWSNSGFTWRLIGNVLRRTVRDKYWSGQQRRVN